MKRFSLFMVLALLLLVMPITHAQDRVTDGTWQASYWNNATLSGDPVLTRQETDPNYGATLGSFAVGVAADSFSARYEKYLDVTAGTYRFQVTVDDGVRVYVDHALVIDKWFNQSATTYTADVTLATGYHYVVIEYYDKSSYAQLETSWWAVGAGSDYGTWYAEFWNNISLWGAPTVTTTVADVNFDWGWGSPIAGVYADRFSARFTRTVYFSAGTYRFYSTVDDGMRLFVGGRPVIDEWNEQPTRTYTYDMYIPAGDREVRVEYFDSTQQAVAKVRWEQLSTTYPTATPQPTATALPTATPQPTATALPTATPSPTYSEVVVEDGGIGFVMGGSETGFRAAYEGSDGRLTWTRNNRVRQPNYNWARWYPELFPIYYEVFAYIPDRYTTTRNAVYWVSHRDGLSKVPINQAVNGNRWVSLGTYAFTGSSSDYVSLNDITGETYLSALIAFDAMKFVPR